MPAAHERSVGDVVRRLQRFPFRPLPLPPIAAFGRQWGADSSVLMIGNSRYFGSPHRYPRSFRPVTLHGTGGTHLAGMQAMHDHRAPVILLCHGLLMTMHFRAVIKLARYMHERWGVHVVTYDQRGCGHSTVLGDEQPSAGWHEGEDLVEVARGLRRDERVTNVHAIGISLGGCGVLNGARVASAIYERTGERLIDSVLSVSGPTHLDPAITYIGTRPRSALHPFWPLWRMFRIGLLYNAWRLGVDRKSHGTWAMAVEEFLAPSYGVDAAEFTRRASAVNFADDIRVPTLHIHGEDDFCVPVDQAWELDAAARDNPNVAVWLLPRGNHAAFEAVDAQWFHSVVRRWLEYWSDGSAQGNEQDQRQDAAAQHRE